jgi:hypothetical protein
MGLGVKSIGRHVERALICLSVTYIHSIYLKKWSLQYFLWHVNFLFQNSVLGKVPVVGLVESTYKGGYSYFEGALFQFRESALYNFQEVFGGGRNGVTSSITAQHSLSSATRVTKIYITKLRELDTRSRNRKERKKNGLYWIYIIVLKIPRET